MPLHDFLEMFPQKRKSTSGTAFARHQEFLRRLNVQSQVYHTQHTFWLIRPCYPTLTLDDACGNTQFLPFSKLKTSEEVLSYITSFLCNFVILYVLCRPGYGASTRLVKGLYSLAFGHGRITLRLKDPMHVKRISISPTNLIGKASSWGGFKYTKMLTPICHQLWKIEKTLIGKTNISFTFNQELSHIFSPYKITEDMIWLYLCMK